MALSFQHNLAGMYWGVPSRYQYMVEVKGSPGHKYLTKAQSDTTNARIVCVVPLNPISRFFPGRRWLERAVPALEPHVSRNLHSVVRRV